MIGLPRALWKPSHKHSAFPILLIKVTAARRKKNGFEKRGFIIFELIHLPGRASTEHEDKDDLQGTSCLRLICLFMSPWMAEAPGTREVWSPCLPLKIWGQTQAVVRKQRGQWDMTEKQVALVRGEDN